MSTTPSGSFSQITATETLPPFTSTFWTTFLAFEPAPTSTEWTTSVQFTTTIAATTRTYDIDVPIPTFPTTSAEGSSTSIASKVSSSTSTGTYATSSKKSSTTSPSTANTSATGPIVVQKYSHKSTAIITSIVVPVLVIFICSAIWLIFFYHRRKGPKPRSVSLKRWLNKSESSDLQRPSGPSSLPAHYDLPDGSFRVGSPPRPVRPKSISESLLDAIVKETSPRSDATNADGVELAELRSPGALNDNKIDFVVSNIDATPILDGTRKKYLQTVIERGLPLDRLTRSSLRVASDAPRHKELSRNSYQAQVPPTDPLRIHKKSASDDVTSNNGKAHRLQRGFEDADYPSPAMTEAEFVTELRRGLSKTPPLQKAIPEDELMGDASTDNGSFLNEIKIAQRREDSLAHLEGRTPELVSPLWSPKPVHRDPLGNVVIPQIPPRLRPRIPLQQLAERRRGVDENVVHTWV